MIKNLNINESHSDKLIPNLMDKKNYICNIYVLKLYLELGLKLTKINRVIRYN